MPANKLAEVSGSVWEVLAKVSWVSGLALNGLAKVKKNQISGQQTNQKSLQMNNL
jgi:hypothetical protein